MRDESPGVIQFARESVDDVLHEILILAKAHYAEIAHYQDIPLDISVDRFRTAEDNGQLRIYTARAPFLVGYGVFAVGTSPKYSGSLQAIESDLFLAPAYRLGRVGSKFIAWCDEQLKAEGVQVVYRHVKAKPELNFGPLLARMGYEHIDNIWGRRLDGR